MQAALGQGDPTATATDPKIPAINFTALKSWKFDLGDRSLFLHRVAPPILPQQSAVPPQAPQPLSKEDARIALRREAKKSEILFLSATVHAHRVTEVRWMNGGHEFSAVSNIDFNLLGGSVNFETADTVYSLLLALANDTAGENGAPTGKLKPIPSLEKLSPNRAQYLIAGDETGAVPQAKDLAALDALHLYFDANRQHLAKEHAKREAARIEQEQRPKEPSPKPKDTVIHYWKMDPASIQAATEEKWK